MDLGKMLADVLRDADREGGFLSSPYDGQPNWVVDGHFNLTAAAEAFLAKVRETEKGDALAKAYFEGMIRAAEIARTDGDDEVARSIEIEIPSKWMQSNETDDHTGPVPYHVEVE